MVKVESHVLLYMKSATILRASVVSVGGSIGIYTHEQLALTVSNGGIWLIINLA